MRADRSRWTWVLAAIATWFALVAHAQPPPEPESSPPHVVSLPPIDLPEGVELPEGGHVEVVVVVAADGSAAVEQCEASDAVCAQVRAAIAAGRFEPARQNGAPVVARVRVTLSVAQPRTDADAGVARPPSMDAGVDAGVPLDAAPAPVAPEPTFGATARAPAIREPGMRRLELSEMRDLPGAFGDPFRAVDALPGVVPIISGLPYFFIRGAPPAGTLYVYDEIPMPTLYHLAAGPAVIHPRMVGPIRLYSGVAPARYGRLTGGVVVGEGPEAPDGTTHGELELRFLDVSGFIQTPALGGIVTAAVRYGYPALLLSIFSPEVNLQYWDYQLRYLRDLTPRDRFELVVLGSYDALAVAEDPDNDITITFHRAEARFTRRIGRTEIGAALMLGWEESALGSGFQIQATRIVPRTWMEHRFGTGSRLRLSADLVGVGGNFSFEPDMPMMMAPESNQPVFAGLAGRSMWGLQAELSLRPITALEIQLGGRADAWLSGSALEAVLDPRARVIVHAAPELDLHAAAGVTHQPAVLDIPLPGLVDLTLDRGLQSAIQSEVGVGWETPLALRAEVQAFLHRYQGLIFLDRFQAAEAYALVCMMTTCADGGVLPTRTDAWSYGVEVFLKRPSEERLSGWVSYTLSWASADDIGGQDYTPSWDVRHVGNLVLSYRLGAGFSAGLRLHARSGKAYWRALPDVSREPFGIRSETHRLPWFVRLDVQVAYQWQPWWGRMRVALEWFNATLTEEPVQFACDGPTGACRVQYLPAIFFPNLSVRGEF